MIARRMGILGAAVVWLVVAAPATQAQTRPDPRLEGRMLREASAQEAQGDLGGAEATLRDLLDRQPSSSGAVFALERVLRSAGRLADVLPVIDRHLDVEPSAGAARFLKVRLLAEVDSLEALEGAVRDWIGAEPDSPDPYREGARIFRDAFGPDQAVALLEEGLDVMDESPLLLIELGDIHGASGRLDDAADAWARALGRDRAQTQAVFRRLDDLGPDRSPVASRIVAALAAPPTTVSRLEIGSELALQEGLDDDARALAEEADARLETREAKGFLNGFARKAEDAERFGTALWAYSRLRDRVDDPVEGRSTDERLVSVALAVGDTAAALDAQRRITGSYAPRSDERQASWADELRIQVALDEPQNVREALEAFRKEYPDSPELDPLAAAVASRLLGRGEREVALDVLAGIEGPGASLERAFLLLESDAFSDGLAALQASLPELEPAEATEMIDLTLMLSRLSGPGARLAARVAIAGHRGHPEVGIQAVATGIDSIPLDDRSAVLSLGARTADAAGDSASAVVFRRRILSDHPDAPELADAALRLARTIARTPEGAAEAVQILETLIVDRPSSPIVPDARRELRRIRERGI